MTVLRQRMLEDLHIRNYAPLTVECYVRSVAEFAKHFKKSPEHLGPEEIRTWQLCLLNEKGVTLSLYIQAICGLRFFYRNTLNRKINIERIPLPRYEKKLPVILSKEEVKALRTAFPHFRRTIRGNLTFAGQCSHDGNPVSDRREGPQGRCSNRPEKASGTLGRPRLEHFTWCMTAIDWGHGLEKLAEEAPAASRKPLKTGRGMLAKYGPAPSAEDIDENRREMFRGFGENF